MLGNRRVPEFGMETAIDTWLMLRIPRPDGARLALVGAETMFNMQFEHVDLLLIDPATSARDTLKTILHEQGFRNLFLGGTLSEIHKHLDHSMPDLLISETELEDGDFCDFVTKLRHNDVGNNPFLPVIGLTWEPTPELVRNVVDAGIADLLTKPLSTGQLLGPDQGPGQGPQTVRRDQRIHRPRPAHAGRAEKRCSPTGGSQYPQGQGHRTL